MTHAPVRSFVYLLLPLLVACDSRAPYPESNDKRAHVFYQNHEFYAKHPQKAIFVSDSYASEPYSFPMRPIGGVLAIPRNHLLVVTHQFQPWANQVYDVASIEATLPDCAPRTKQDSENLIRSASLDRLSITLGNPGNELSSAQYREGVKNGTLVLDARLSSSDIPVYRKSVDTAGAEPFFALPDPSRSKSPLGKEIVIICPPKGHEAVESDYPTGDCTVQIVLPPSYFPRANADSFGGVAGVRLSYSFNEKYLPQWSTLHPRVLAFVRGFVQQ